MPVAANCKLAGKTRLGFCGVTNTRSRIGAVTVNVAEPVFPPNWALMVVGPCPWLIANPKVLMVATLVTLESHMAAEVRSCCVELL